MTDKQKDDIYGNTKEQVPIEMKILYVTDLHGDKEKYKKTLEIAIEKGIHVIVNGGDMLPKQCNRHLEQPVFIKGFLREYFKELQEQSDYRKGLYSAKTVKCCCRNF